MYRASTLWTGCACMGRLVRAVGLLDGRTVGRSDGRSDGRTVGRWGVGTLGRTVGQADGGRAGGCEVARYKSVRLIFFLWCSCDQHVLKQ